MKPEQMPPGLISIRRERCSAGYHVEEEWDLTVPGCPVIVFRTMPEFERNDSAVFLRRSYIVRA